MDCPRSRDLAGIAVRFLAPAGCLLMSLGCIPQSTLPVAPTITVAKKETEEKPKQAPKSTTCVSFGDFYTQAANEPQRSPQEQEEMRDQARRAYQQALEIDPRCLPAYAGLAHLYQVMGDTDRALTTYRKGLEVDPKQAFLWFQLGMFQARQKQWPEAIKSLQTAQELEPENRSYLRTLGFCLARAGRADDSVTCLKKVMPEAQAHYNVARMLHHNQDEAGCRQHLQLALRLQPDLAPARQFLDELDSRKTTVVGPSAIPTGFEGFEGADLAAPVSFEPPARAESPSRGLNSAIRLMEPQPSPASRLENQPTALAEPSGGDVWKKAGQ